MIRFFKFTGFLMSLCFSAQVSAQNHSYAFEVQVGFTSGQSQLSDQTYFELSALVRDQFDAYRRQSGLMSADQNTLIVVQQVIIKSRTDAKGSEATNMAISENRAEGLAEVLAQIFFTHNVTYDINTISTIGLGESEADEEACQYMQFICSSEKIKYLRKTSGPPEKNWLLAAYDFLTSLIIPFSHAREPRTLLDMLFGSPRQPEPPVRYDDPNEVYPDVESCEQVVWDEQCLDSQRRTTIEIYFDVIQKPAETIIETPLPPPAAPVPQLNLYGNPL